MKKLKLFLGVALFGAMSFGAFSAYDYATMSEEERFLLANIEALTSDEVLEGKICRYKGTTSYGDYLPCTASYPNIGPCGERTFDYYSNDTGQCYSK